MTEREALKLALEALKQIDEAMPFPVAKLAQAAIKEALSKNEFKPDWDEKLALTEEVIRLSKRIEELEAQPSVSVEQSTECGEPVAWCVYCDGQFNLNIFRVKDVADVKKVRLDLQYPNHKRKVVPLYTTPPQRKPLTLGQKQRLWSSVGDKPTLKDRVNAYGLAIEAAHGIKSDYVF